MRFRNSLAFLIKSFKQSGQEAILRNSLFMARIKYILQDVPISMRHSRDGNRKRISFVK